MEALKSNMMTMIMFQQMNGRGNSQKQDLFGMIYMFLATNFIDHLFKYLPLLVTILQRFYHDKFSTMQRELANSTVDHTDNKVKKKTASITITVNVNNPDNMLGQAVLDFITNNRNTTHVSYIRDSFILNQKDVINIDEDVFAKMTESTADSTGGSLMATQSGSSNGGIGGSGGGGNGAPAIVQIIEIYSFTKTTDQLRAYLDNIKQKYMIAIKNKLGNRRYFFNMHPISAPMEIGNRKDFSRLPPNMIFTMKHFQTNRKFSNLFGDDIDLIRSRVHFFCKNRKWYDEKGIPYTLGLLLSGNPGTGKTSTIKCLANETNRHICNVNLNNDITKRQLENLFFNEDITVLNQNTGQTETFCIPLDQRIYVLEDVDCQTDIVRDRTQVSTLSKKCAPPDPTADADAPPPEDKHKIDLSFLLNFLDGVLENPGRIVIMTSNFPEVLDGALIRPGRIDIIAKFRNCTIETMVNMIEFFYDITLDPQDLIAMHGLRSEIVTPAELSKIMFENFSDYRKTIQTLVTISNNGEKHQVTSEESKTTSSVTTDTEESAMDDSESKQEVAVTVDASAPSAPPNSNYVMDKGLFKEDQSIGGVMISCEVLNAKMQEYREIIEKEVLSRFEPIWSSREQMNYKQDLKKELLKTLRRDVFEEITWPRFQNYTRCRYDIETNYTKHLSANYQTQWISILTNDLIRETPKQQETDGIYEKHLEFNQYVTNLNCQIGSVSNMLGLNLLMDEVIYQPASAPQFDDNKFSAYVP